MKNCFLALSAWAFVVLGLLRPAAAEVKPVVVVSISSYDSILSDIDYIGGVVGQPQMNAASIDGILKFFTGGKGADMLDRKAPWGFALLGEGTDFQPLVFLPIKDYENLITVMGNFQAKIQDEDDGIKSVQVQQAPVKMYMKHQTGYVYFSNRSDVLKTLPADPAVHLGTLPKEYDIGVRAFVQNVPEEMRNDWVSLIRAGMEQGLRQSPGEDDNAFAMRKKLVESQMGQLEMVFKELDTLTLGVNIDSVAKAVFLDMSLTGKPGSIIASRPTTTSGFAGFLQANAGLTGNITSKLTPQEVTQYQSMIQTAGEALNKEVEKDDSLDEGGKTVAKQMLADLLDIVSKTVETGKLDGSGSVAFSDKTISAFAGAAVHDGKAVEQLLKKILQIDDVKSGLRDVKLDTAEHNGVKFHQLGVPVPDAKAQEIFGDTLTLTFGIGDKAVYFAAGKDGIQSIKSGIDASTAAGNAKLDPFSLNFAAAAVANFAASVNNEPGAELAAQTLKGAEGKDHIIVTGKEIPNGGMMRVQIDEGIIRLGGAMSGARRGGGRAVNPPL